jgi:dCTP deaminase
MILSAQSIRWYKPVDPFLSRTIHNETGMSFGLSACGYDIRVREALVVPAHGFVLASSVERFRMDPEIMAVVHDKSSWARKGLAVQNTVIEPGWEGYLTLEVTNSRDWSLKIPAGAPIAQVIFHKLDQATDQPYHGKYQDQPARPVPAIREKAA